MLSRVLMVGLLAGLVAGLALAVLQHFTMTPMIVEAESFEHAGEAVQSGVLRDFGDAKLILAHTAADPAAGEHDHGGEAGWAPEDGLERTVYTGLATILCAVGFAFVLLAGMLIAGDEITERKAIGWGLAAFVATGLAPAFGLSPELPASAAAALEARQLWWLATAVATGVSLWLFLRTEAPWAKVLAIVILIAPHVVGAPQPEAFESRVPAELSAEFTARSIAFMALMWVAVAWAVGALWRRLGGAAS